MRQSRNLFIKSILIALLLCSCSTTKRIPQGEQLYNGVKKITIVSEGNKLPGEVMSAIKEPISVPPNNPLFSPYSRTPFPIGLWAYNHFYTEKKKGFKHWMFDKLAKEPILISTVNPQLRLNVVKGVLNNLGYFGATTSYTLTDSKRNKKKAKISYKINVPRPYDIDTIVYQLPNTELGDLIRESQATSILQIGGQYNADTLFMERNRITSIVRKKGYYYFKPEYIDYLADSTLKPKEIALRIRLKPGIPANAFRPYRVGKVTVLLEGNSANRPLDTLYFPNLEVFSRPPRKIRKHVLMNNVILKPGTLFNLENQNQTLANLNRLGIFRYVNMNVTPFDSIGHSDSLNVLITTAYDRPFEAEFEANVTQKSSNFVGPGATFSVSNNNLMGGGEVLTVKLNGAYEWQTGKRQDAGKSGLVNSYEFGINSTLYVPRLIAPYNIRKRNKYPARTGLQLGANLMNRPGYFRMASFSGSGSYNFQTSKQSFHTLTPFKLVYNRLLNTSESFEETMDKNPAIALSFKDQFIPSMGYSYIWDKTISASGNRLFWQTTVTQAGNILAGAISIFQHHGQKELLGNQFSQFVKGSTELKYFHRLWGNNWLATRFLIGAGHAYGNSEVMPYSEQFYIGGANSIRAFTIRTLGPGSYRPDVENVNGYFDQTGDFKLEANAEFRFEIYKALHGAIFLDAGNIWLLKKDPNRPGGNLEARTFFKDIALGTGFGLRYDISFLVIRADLGIGIHTPYPNPKKSGYYNISSFKDGLGFHIAVGYPF